MFGTRPPAVHPLRRAAHHHAGRRLALHRHAQRLARRTGRTYRRPRHRNRLSRSCPRRSAGPVGDLRRLFFRLHHRQAHRRGVPCLCRAVTPCRSRRQPKPRPPYPRPLTVRSSPRASSPMCSTRRSPCSSAFVPQFIEPSAPSKVLAFLFLGGIFTFNGVLVVPSSPRVDFFALSGR